MFEWIKESHRLYHLAIGFVCTLVAGFVAGLLVLGAMEGKDCQYDSYNHGKPLTEWRWTNWDWLDIWAGVIGAAGAVILRLAMAATVIMVIANA